MHQKNDNLEDKTLLMNAIKSCVVLQNLDDKAKIEVLSKMSLCKVNPGDYLFKEGNIGFYFYVIKSGKVKLFIKGTYKKSISKGEGFGEVALIHTFL